MFFYPNVLDHRTGCFATIWLAATKGRKISRRDLLKVNVQRTCYDVMDYVLAKVPPPAPGLPRPRFSLYLSSQLQYGVVLVYHRQCDFLLEDIQGAIDRLLRFSRKANIDLMVDETRHMIPDALALLDETEWARDPFFGVMDTGYGLPSPSSLIQLALPMEEALTEPTPPRREPTPTSDGITASQESITITEREPVTMPEPEFEGADLLETNMIDLLLEQPDYFPEGEDERQQEIAREREAREREREEDRELRVPDEREQERAALEREATPSVSVSELVQITGISSKDVILLPEEDLGLPMEMPVLEEREKTPVPVSLPIPEEEPMRERRVRERSPSLEPAVMSPESPKVQQKRRKQLLFIDEDKQISQEEMEAQINNVDTETRPLANILIKLPFEKSDPKTLFANPCMKLPPEILELWKQAAVLKPVAPSVRRREVSVAEEIPEKEAKQEELGEMELERELSSKEIPREMVESESGLLQQETPTSLVVLETTDKDFSPLETPESRRSPVLFIQYGLEDIPEERIPGIEDITVDLEEPLRPLAPEGLVTFHSLLPPKASRRIVAHSFWRLLEKTTAKQITVQQDEPYGDIIISQME